MKELAAKPDLRSSLNAAVNAHKAGDLDRAETLYRQILKNSPQEFDALSLLGTVLCQKKQLHKGLEYLQTALKLRPQSLNLLLNTGLCLQELDRNTEALEIFEKGDRLSPNSPVFLRGRATALLRLSRFSEALECYVAIEGKKANTAADDINHGLALYELGKYEGSLARLTKALRANAADPALLYNTGRCLLKLGKLMEARNSFDSALKISPDDSKTLIARAETARAMNDSASALLSIEQALTLDSKNSFARGFKASLLLDLGQRAEAAKIFRDLAENQQEIGEALIGLSQCKTFTSVDGDAEMILAGRTLPGIEPAALSLIQFAASKCFDDLGMHDDAFLAATAARKLMPPSKHRDVNLEAVRQAFSREFLQAFPSAGNNSELPVFIVGMPRSGTSLIEQIIASHPNADGAGELEYLIRIGKSLGALEDDPALIAKKMTSWNAAALEQAAGYYLQALARNRSGVARITDKMPHNFMLIGLISILFPNAKIIHVKRNAADTCLSIYLNNLRGGHDYANDLAALGKYYRSYTSLMQHWHDVLGSRIHLCNYESLVGNPETEIRQMLSYLDLTWDEKCLRFFDTERSVTTFSRGQVREPIYARSIGRWRKYEKHLAPLLDELGNLHSAT